MKSDGVGGLERGGEGRRREGKEVEVSVKGQQGFSRMVPQKTVCLARGRTHMLSYLLHT